MALYCSPDYHTNFESTGLSVQDWSSIRIDFQDGSHGGHTGIPIWCFSLFFISVPNSPLWSFNWSFGLKERKIKIDFQHGSRGNHLGFLIVMISAIFDLQVAPILQLAFWVKKKDFEIDFQDGSSGIHLGFLTGTILSMLICKSPWCLLPNFQWLGLLVPKVPK